MEVERPHNYRQNSNCQDIHHSDIPLSGKHNLLRQKFCERGQ